MHLKLITIHVHKKGRARNLIKQLNPSPYHAGSLLAPSQCKDATLVDVADLSKGCFLHRSM
jgi:hypothetical protein